MIVHTLLLSCWLSPPPVGGALSTYGREVRDAETSYIAQAILRQQSYLTYKVWDAKI